MLNLSESPKFLQWFKSIFRNFFNLAENDCNFLKRCRKNCGKRRKYQLPAFSPFTARLSKDYFVKDFETWDCVVKR